MIGALSVGEMGGERGAGSDIGVDGVEFVVVWSIDGAGGASRICGECSGATFAGSEGGGHGGDDGACSVVGGDDGESRAGHAGEGVLDGQSGGCNGGDGGNL